MVARSLLGISRQKMVTVDVYLQLVAGGHKSMANFMPGLNLSCSVPLASDTYFLKKWHESQRCVVNFTSFWNVHHADARRPHIWQEAVQLWRGVPWKSIQMNVFHFFCVSLPLNPGGGGGVQLRIFLAVVAQAKLLLMWRLPFKENFLQVLTYLRLAPERRKGHWWLVRACPARLFWLFGLGSSGSLLLLGTFFLLWSFFDMIHEWQNCNNNVATGKRPGRMPEERICG